MSTECTGCFIFCASLNDHLQWAVYHSSTVCLDNDDVVVYLSIRSWLHMYQMTRGNHYDLWYPSNILSTSMCILVVYWLIYWEMRSPIDRMVYREAICSHIIEHNVEGDQFSMISHDAIHQHTWMHHPSNGQIGDHVWLVTRSLSNCSHSSGTCAGWRSTPYSSPPEINVDQIDSLINSSIEC